MSNVLDGKACSQTIKDDLKNQVNQIITNGQEVPGLAVVTVGDDGASKVYVRNKHNACDYIGYHYRQVALPEEATEEELLNEIDKLNVDPSIHGIIVQLPLPKHIHALKAINRVASYKDVDGFTINNLGMLASDRPVLASCTPMGVMALLEANGIKVAGKNAVVIGRSIQVGKPMAQMLLSEDATVTICHSKTPEAEMIQHIGRADIVVSAVGKAGFIGNPDIFKKSAVIVDIGINRDENGKLCGDITPSCYEAVDYYTPVPGGVGPMTVAILMVNIMRAYQLQQMM